MDPAECIWFNGEFIEWDNAKVHFLAHTLHYGAGAFEGIRFYKTEDGPAVFRLDEHLERLFYSCRAIHMEPSYSLEDLREATKELVARNKIDQGYIRPIVYYGYGIMGLNPSKAPVNYGIACWAWGAYLPHEMVDVKISKYIRIHPKSTVADAKICGNYVNSILAVLELKDSHYHEALLLDADGNVAEGPGENIFIVKNETLYTPKLGTILPGITRDTAMRMWRDFGNEVIEKDLTPDDIYNADEAFFTGTAAEVTPIKSLDDKPIGKGSLGPVTEKIRDTYLDIVFGRNEQYRDFLTYIK